MSLTIRPIHDNVWVKPDDRPKKSPGGIILPDAAKTKPLRGTVLAVGPGINKRYRDSAEFIPMEVKVGDSVIYPTYAGKEIEINGEIVTMMNECDIVGIVVDDGKPKAK
jgi:chaperonin GroES